MDPLASSIASISGVSDISLDGIKTAESTSTIIPKAYFYHALRELLTPEGLFLYDEDLEKLVPHTNLDNTLVVRSPLDSSVEIVCTFSNSFVTFHNITVTNWKFANPEKEEPGTCELIDVAEAKKCNSLPSLKMIGQSQIFGRQDKKNSLPSLTTTHDPLLVPKRRVSSSSIDPNARECFYADIISQGKLQRLISAADRSKGDALMEEVEQVLGLADYPSTEKEFLTWTQLLNCYISTYKALPPRLFIGNILRKVASNNAAMCTFLAALDTVGVKELLFKQLLEHIGSQKDHLLAVKFIKGGWAIHFDRTQFYYLALSLKNKLVDFALLDREDFIDFLFASKNTLVGTIAYNQLLERIKDAFAYRNLPDDYTDIRQTQANGDLLQINRKRIADVSKWTYLSYSEVTHYFMIMQPINRLKLANAWLETYQKNLCLILSNFFPHLPQHLAEIAAIYRLYKGCTLAITASIDGDRYDPSRHVLASFPESISQYIKRNSSDKDAFEKNLLSLRTTYEKMGSYNTIRMRSDCVLEYSSIERVAKFIREKLPDLCKEVGDEAIAKMLSIKLTGHFSKTQNPLISEKTVTNITQGGQILWIKSYEITTFTEVIDCICNEELSKKITLSALLESIAERVSKKTSSG